MADSWTKRSDGSTVWASRTGNVSSPVTWTTATRPTTGLFDGKTGINTDFDGLESYNLATEKWRIINGTWTTNTRPATASVDVGSQGFNSDAGFGIEMWNGTEWVLL